MQVRFAVTHQNLRSASWVCLGSLDNSIYLICRELKSVTKFSFHGTSDWRNAFTQDFVDAEVKAGTSRLPPRLLDRWSRPREFAPGYTLACRIQVPRASVTEPFAEPPRKLFAVPAPESPK